MLPWSFLGDNPLCAPFDKFLQEDTQIREDESAYVKGEELGCVPSAELEPNLCLVCMAQPGVLDLSRDLV